MSSLARGSVQETRKIAKEPYFYGGVFICYVRPGQKKIGISALKITFKPLRSNQTKIHSKKSPKNPKPGQSRPL